MSHLDDQETKSRPSSRSKTTDSTIDQETLTKVRTGIAIVLSSIVAVAATDTIGLSVLETINSLLEYLKTSITNCVRNTRIKSSEQRFQVRLNSSYFCSTHSLSFII